ncbi:DEAD/DEAH box helicase family protein [Polyangium sp. 6x1]|uniref:DEAD/DEAH box helicase family protein n=1 Tax=Polyangium sp. 6x1 TaxID=3042689 RepID=UPI0024822BDE|nr:DEAD/DEAH box helicase family protein [Polyangium sp. 6x1]MDI1450791.1 DEAD/DEAH box helicase family protein [Polyangium sp. 6x1]
MIDFKKLTKKRVEEQVTDPIKLYYEKLEPASNTGPLRPAQEGVLVEWRDNRRNARDLVLKLHTGDGKTLVGLLIGQSQLNAGKGPALYLCPNKYLVAQTCDEASRFGISIVTAEPDLPPEFLEGQKILVTTVQKLFNGLTKFGRGTQSIKVGTLLMDDAHACVDAIRDAFTINLDNDAAAYRSIRDLFADELRKQGAGTFADIEAGDSNGVLMVPYWAWQEKHDEVVRVLASAKGSEAVKYVWPLLKDRLRDCVCLVSGKKLQITPYLPPLEEFGTYTKASRIFMSATTANDAFLVRGLGLAPDVVQKPLVYEKQKWLGEKMILIPSLIDDSLDRSEIVNRFGKPRPDRKYGVVALVPGFARTKDWGAVGAHVVETSDIEEVVARLRKGEAEKTVVLVNRYDGVDLPDKACRILIVDSKPVAETLLDRYMADCVAGSEMITAAIMRKIEQGLGRSVRGEKDSSVILLIGPDLVALVRTAEGRRFLSVQTQRQIEIGLEVARLAKTTEVQDGKATTALVNVINQSLRRDDGWREYYKEEMNAMATPTPNLVALSTFELERAAELKFQDGNIDGAIAIVDKLGNQAADPSEQGWYLQEKARYEYARSQTEADKLQAAAHKRNRRLLKPRTGMDFKRITIVNQKRPELIKAWVVKQGDGEQLQVRVAELLDRLQFGVSADRFEAAWDELGRALGFVAERPDKDWGEGPDNLWALREKQYLLAEAKSEIDVTRAEIHKDESQQMNNSSAWFAKNYGDVPVKRLIIHPAQKLAKSAAFHDDVEILSQTQLNALRKAVRSFYREFANVDFAAISEKKIEEALVAHKLTIDNILTLYSKKPVSFGKPRI